MPTLEPPQEIQTNAFVCNCEKWMRTACAGEGYYKEYEGKRYCLLHYPSKEKVEDFKIVLEKKVKSEDFDFRGVWFPDHVNFARVDFSVEANFSGATFSADAYFERATFSAIADFNGATFSAGAHFGGATFSADANFGGATFKDLAYFEGKQNKRTFGDQTEFNFQF